MGPCGADKVPSALHTNFSGILPVSVESFGPKQRLVGLSLCTEFNEFGDELGTSSLMEDQYFFLSSHDISTGMVDSLNLVVLKGWIAPGKLL
mgnify:CR=1 FL=1